MKGLVGLGLPEIPWYEAEPVRFERDTESIRTVAPSLQWDPVVGQGGGWTGELPIWPFDRSEPTDLRTAVTGGLIVSIEPQPAHPAVEPTVFPINPKPSVAYRTMHDWHLRGDGSLCLLQLATDWSGRESAAELAVMAAGWYLEYLLMDAGIVSKMTLGGIAFSRKYDAFLGRYIARRLERFH